VENKRIERTLKYINNNDLVLDLGCVHHDANNYKREDWIHKHIVKKAKKTVGADIEVKEIEYLNQLGFDIRYCNIEENDFPNKNKQAFNVINAGELIEHLANPGKFLEHCKIMLKDDGILIISTPNVWNYYNLLSIVFRGKVPLHVQHTCWYDKKTLSQLVKRYGYRIQYFEYLPMSGGKGTFVGNLLQLIKLKMLGGEALFFVLTKK